MSLLKYITIPDFELDSGASQNIQLSYQHFGKPLHEAPIVMVNQLGPNHLISAQVVP